jgi:hypothetical protein
MKVSPPRGRTQAKDLILRLIACAEPAGGFEGKTRLFKAFYYAHLYFLEDTGRFLTPWAIVRMPRGPGIDEGEDLIRELVQEGTLRSEGIMAGPFPSVRYRLAGRADFSSLRHGDPHEDEAVQRAVEHALSRTAEQLTAEVHEYSRAWRKAANGEPLDLALDVTTSEEDDEMEGLLDESSRDLKSIWGD